MDIITRKLSDELFVFSTKCGHRATYNVVFNEVSITGSLTYSSKLVYTESSAREYFRDYLLSLANSEEQDIKFHGGKRKGSGRKKSDDPKSVMRVTESEKLIIQYLRKNPAKRDSILLDLF